MAIEGIGSYDEDYFWKDAVAFGNKVGGSVSAKGDLDGNTNARVEGHLTHENEDGSRVKATIEGGVQRDKDGNYKGGFGAEVGFEKDYLFIKV